VPTNVNLPPILVTLTLITLLLSLIFPPSLPSLLPSLPHSVKVSSKKYDTTANTFRFYYCNYFDVTSQCRKSRLIKSKSLNKKQFLSSLFSPLLPFAGGWDFRRESSYLKDALKEDVKEATKWAKRAGRSFLKDLKPMQLRGGTVDKDADDDAVAAAPKPPSSHATTPQTVAVKTLPADVEWDRYSPVSPVSAIIANSAFIEVGDFSLDDLSDIFASLRGAAKKTVMNTVADDFIALSLTTASLPAAGYKSPLFTETGEQIDALRFCAVLRLFADWRLKRQVPDGYKGYAVGMNIGFKDVVQNLAKLETSTITMLTHAGAGGSMRDVLVSEIFSNYHSNVRLPKLRDPSGAIGMIWIMRQLKYQVSIYKNLIEDDGGPTSAAVWKAYDEVYGQVHGWAVRKIFEVSFKASPNPQVIYKTMQGSSELAEEECEHKSKAQMKRFIEVTEPVLQHVEEILNELNMMDLTRV